MYPTSDTLRASLVSVDLRVEIFPKNVWFRLFLEALLLDKVGSRKQGRHGDDGCMGRQVACTAQSDAISNAIAKGGHQNMT